MAGASACANEKAHRLPNKNKCIWSRPFDVHAVHCIVISLV